MTVCESVVIIKENLGLATWLFLLLFVGEMLEVGLARAA